MSTLQLFGWQGNSRTRIAQVTAEYSGVSYELVHTNPQKNEGLDKEPYASTFPWRRIPCMIDGDIKISQCIAIATHIAQKTGDKAGILGKTKKEQAEVQQWGIWATADFGNANPAWFKPLEGITPYNKKTVDDAEKESRFYFSTLEKILHTRTFLVGERLTLADIAGASMLQRGLRSIFDESFRDQYPNVFRWFETVVNQPPYLKVNGKPATEEYIKTRAEPPKAAPKAKESKAQAVGAGTGGAAVGAGTAAPKAASAPKPKKKEDDEEDEPAVPAEPKAKHPCEALGAAKSFPFDEWKRQYSNNDTPDAIKWLKENLAKEPSDYSFWKATYKYPTELTQVFMSSNLIGGFHNRLEGSRKYLFGSAGVYGKNNDSAIQGVYMVRGPDYKPVFDVAPDAESYEFEKLDFDKDHELISQVWSWEGTMEGGSKAFADGKVFK